MSNSPATKSKNPWRDLWQEWFDDNGDPWCYDSGWGVCDCLFCGETRPRHIRGCVYVKAKQLLEQTSKEAANE